MKWKLVKLLVVLIMSLVVLSGCTDDITNKIGNKDGNKPNLILPNKVQEWVENSQAIFLGQTYEYDGKLYILATYGTKPSGGFAVKITGVRELNDVIEVDVEFTKPEPGQMVTEAITYPYDLVDIKPTTKEIKFVAAGAEIHVPTLLGVDRLEPIVAGEKGVMVFAPAPNIEIKDGKIIFRGITNTYEGTANYRIKSGSGVVQEGFVTGSMGDWGYFSEVIALPETVSGPLTFEIYIISPKDGKEMDKFSIPLNAAGRKLPPTQGAFPNVQLLPINESAGDPQFKKYLDNLMKAVKEKDVAAFKEHLADDFSYSFGDNANIAGFIQYWGLDKNPAESELWAKLTTAIELGGTFLPSEGKTYYLAPYVYSAFPVEFNEYEFAAITNKNVPVFMEPDKGAQVLEHLDYHLIRLQGSIDNADPWIKIQTSVGNTGYVESVNLRSPLEYRAGFVNEGDRWQMIFFIAGD
ncbi:MAG: protease complex subunit PrcB family protein [Clostridia bacterium]|nr:protease complex subunit PrcB family protein [Clostridia bacterium]